MATGNWRQGRRTACRPQAHKTSRGREKAGRIGGQRQRTCPRWVRDAVADVGPVGIPLGGLTGFVRLGVRDRKARFRTW